MALKLGRRSQVPPFIAMDVLRAANERAAAGEDVLHLEVGQPATAAPAAVLAAARTALGAETLGYTDALGLPALREAIAAHYRDAYGVAVEPARVVVTTGSSGAFLLGFLAAFDAGDRVAMAAPGYPAYRNILTALDLVPVELAAGPAERYQMTLDLLRSHSGHLDGLIIASPANPTGTMIAPDELAALARYCRDMGIRFVSDEIYHGIVYGAPAVTALATSAEAIVVNSFSKYFSMTGWRLGWMVVPPDMLRAVECLAQNLYISPPALSQHAALAAFGARAELDANVARYAANRALLLEELPKAGFTRFAPADGAFYLYADVAHLTNDSPEFCRRMLREIGVACTPGIDFDPARGHASLRISFAGSTETMAEAARRLKSWRR
ncbi:MAG TPA: aminotransferase class I/II-fold pyridoxal phosphate-dependent enzyme [Stellaceae bacterium]|nr:aminotransferase class I/II-fold pyridoxal phosphate-dependent enzyme [Stellaceae bacterium]